MTRAAGLGRRLRLLTIVPACCVLGLLITSARAGAVSLQSLGSFTSAIYVTAPPGDQRLFVVERAGTIQVLHDGMRTQFLDIHAMVDSSGGERGMESMAFDPNYATNGLFYVFYTENGTAGGAVGDIRVEEFHVSSDPNVADPDSRRTVWTFSHSSPMHNGGQLQFGPDGLLYISSGDAGNASNAQSPDNPYGKILRIDPHGVGSGVHGVPASNPFPGAGTPEVWSIGLRNPFRFSFDHLTGDLVIGDVGGSAREEIDYSPATAGAGRGTNYGWPCREGFIAGPTTCTGKFVDPVFDYPHTDPGGGQLHGCAIIGGFVYRGSQIPELSGRYVYTDFCTPATLRSIQLGLPLAGDDRPEAAIAGAPQSFGEDANCELYLATGGAVYKIVGSAPPSVPPACATPPAEVPSTQPQPQPQVQASTQNGCIGPGKTRPRSATGARKRRKRCVRGSWASRL